MNRSRLAALSAGATFLVASVMAPATAMAAGTGSVSLSPANVSTSVGSTFFVDINTQASVAMSGASATIDFDKTMLQIVSVTKPAMLAVGGPLTNSVAVNRQGRALNLSYQLLGAGGEASQLLGARRQPEFAAYRAGKKVASGKFEFG